MTISTVPMPRRRGMGNYLAESELIPGAASGQAWQGPWLSVSQVKPSDLSYPTRHHQSFGGFGLGQGELERVRAERADVQREIARLQGGGQPVRGGYQSSAVSRDQQAQAVAVAVQARQRKRYVTYGVVGAAALALWALTRR